MGLSVVCLLAVALAGQGQAQSPESAQQEGYVGTPADGGRDLVYFRFVPDSVLVLGEGLQGEPRVSLDPRAFSALLAELARAGALTDPSAPEYVFESQPEPAGLRLGALVPLKVALLAGLCLAGGVAGGIVALGRRRASAHVRREGEVRRVLHEGREAERVHLARELHDGPVQELCALQMALVPPGAGWDADAEAARETVAEVVAELRRVCDRLRPPALEAFGLGPALVALADRLRARTHGLTVSYWGHPPAEASVGGLSPEVQLGLYRIVQEAVNNAARHSEAERVTVRLQLEPAVAGGEIVLTVEDDGRGLTAADPVELAATGHYGLLGMRERAEAIEAKLRIGTADGGGTRVEARVATPSTNPVRPPARYGGLFPSAPPPLPV